MIHFQQTSVWPNKRFHELKQDCEKQELMLLEKLEENWQLGICQFQKEGEGLLLAIKEEKLIGIASIQQSTDAPSTSGIAFLQNCYILKRKEEKDTGNNYIDMQLNLLLLILVFYN